MSSRIVGYVVVAYRWKSDLLVYVGDLTKDVGMRRPALFNGVDQATIFATRKAANAAVTASKKYWNDRWSMDLWNVVALRRP